MTSTLVDTHGHLNFAAFADSWQAVVERSRARGVMAVVMPGSQQSTSARSIALARAMPNFLYAAVGLHPTHVLKENQKLTISNETEKFEIFDYERYLELARRPEVVAIGEVGLDSYRLPPGLEDRLTLEDWISEQERVLREFIRLAKAVEKPLILHCRGAKKPGMEPLGLDPHVRLLEILRQESHLPRFVVHCYQGSVDQAKQYLALGGLISFTGTITFSDDRAVTEVVRAVPLDRLMLETDSPYLSPQTYRGEQNEPWKVLEVARRVGELTGQSLEEICQMTSRTAVQFFQLKLSKMD
jgi:TatD DNase family protein